MKILALDISTRSTGWFVSKRSCGILHVPDSLQFEQKLVYFRKELLKLLKKYKPEVVVIEDAYYQPRKGSIHTLKTLSKFGGVASEVSALSGAKVEILTATQARKYCCGDQEGAFKKREVFEFFITKYDLDWSFEEKNDITDAMALSWGYREKERLTKKNGKKTKKK